MIAPHAQAEGEEGMAQGVEQAGAGELAPLEAEHEVNALSETAGGDAVAHQNRQQHKQQGHEPAHRGFQARHHPPGNDEDHQGHEEGMPKQHLPRAAQKLVEGRDGLVPAGAGEAAASHAEDVLQRPAGDDGVEGKDQEARDDAHPTHQHPSSVAVVLLGQGAHAVDWALPPPRGR